MVESAQVFTAYSHQDEPLRDELEAHLAVLKREGRVDVFHDRRIVAGQDWEAKIDARLLESDIILLLVSSDFLASDYCYGVEMQTAMRLHDEGRATAIPVILRPCEWQQDASLARLQALPKDAKAATVWPNLDEALLDVTRGVRRALDEMGPKPIPLHSIYDWSPSSLVLGRMMKIHEGGLARPRKAVILLMPDQAILEESLVVALYVTDDEGRPADGVRLILALEGGRFGGAIGVQVPRDVRVTTATTPENGYVVFKVYPEEAVVKVSATVDGYGQFLSSFYVAPSR